PDIHSFDLLILDFSQPAAFRAGVLQAAKPTAQPALPPLDRTSTFALRAEFNDPLTRPFALRTWEPERYRHVLTLLSGRPLPSHRLPVSRKPMAREDHRAGSSSSWKIS